MKKIAILLSVLFFTATLTAQHRDTSTIGGKKTMVRSLGGIMSDSSMVVPSFRDTSIANTSVAARYPHSIIKTQSPDAFWVRNKDATGWVISGNPTYTDCEGLIRPGYVSWRELLKFDVSRARYCIGGVYFGSRDTTITLTPADATHGRIDVIAVDTNRRTVLITGVASATPVTPQVDPFSQLYLTSIFIPAGATSLGYSYVIWDENTGSPEYVGGAVANVNFNSTAKPYRLTKSTKIDSAATVTYNGNDIDLSNYNLIRFYLQSSLGADKNVSIQLLYDSVAITNALPISFDVSDTSYQNISVPLEQFVFLSEAEAINGVRFIVTGNGYNLDYITLNGGVNTGTGGAIMDIWRAPGTDSVKVLQNGLERFAFIDSTGGGGTGNDSAYVNSYVDTSINALILIRDNGGEDTIYYVGGGGSGGLDSTLYVKYTDTAAMLSPYLQTVDTTNKWFANGSKINDSTYRFYKGTGFFDVVVPVGGGGTNIYNSNGALTGSRTVDGNGNNIHFDDMGDFNVTAAGGLVLNGATYGVGVVGGLFSLNMPSGSSTDSIVVWDASTLQFKVRTQTSGGSPTPDTVYAKFPIQVDQTGVNDTLNFKLPPQSVPVNLHATDTLEAQFMKVNRKLISVLSDTVRWTTSGTAPSGTPEIYYRWSQLGSTVNLQIWAYYPTNGTSVTGAAITLPSDVPVPNYPAGWLAGDLIIAQGTGGIYVNRTRTLSELSTSSAECVLKRDNGNTRWELQNKSGTVSARYTMWNIVYETSDY